MDANRTITKNRGLPSNHIQMETKGLPNGLSDISQSRTVMENREQQTEKKKIKQQIIAKLSVCEGYCQGYGNHERKEIEDLIKEYLEKAA